MMREISKRLYGIHRRIVDDALGALKRGKVWCRECGQTQQVDSAHCLAHGWPQCCGYTMSITAPSEAGGEVNG